MRQRCVEPDQLSYRILMSVCASSQCGPLFQQLLRESAAATPSSADRSAMDVRSMMHRTRRQ